MTLAPSRLAELEKALGGVRASEVEAVIEHCCRAHEAVPASVTPHDFAVALSTIELAT